MTTNTQVGNYPPLPAKVIKVIDESFAPGRTPESFYAWAAGLGWSAYHAEFFKAAAQSGWVRLSDLDSAKALLMFTQEMFNQFKSPGGAELQACEGLLMAHSFTSVGPGLAGLCRNPGRAASVSAVFETAPSAGNIPALALIAC